MISQTPYFNRAGWPFMAVAILLTIVMSFINSALFGLMGIVSAWCFYFFRDPTRMVPLRSGLIVSPADGRVVAVEEVNPDPSLDLGVAPRQRISIFLNVFNVHINRMPAEGSIVKRSYYPGTFVNASLDKASAQNERMSLTVELKGDHPFHQQRIAVVQIAGLIARRIVCSAQEGDQMVTGQRYGLIRFGSRCDVYLPVGVNPLVAIGQTAIGGETVIGDCLAPLEVRKGEAR